MEKLESKQQEQVLKKLEEVVDPELFVDVVSLGLIYELEKEKSNLKITMTLTFPGCPYGDTLMEQVKEKAEELNLFEKVDVNLTFEPPWNPDKIDPDIRAALNI